MNLIIINYSAYLAIGQGRRFSKLNQRPRHRWALLGLKFGAIHRFDLRKTFTLTFLCCGRSDQSVPYKSQMRRQIGLQYVSKLLSPPTL
jgi:hypothetical protein